MAVAFKGLAAPKRRLAPLLTLAERRAISLAMLTDVLSSAREARGFSRRLLVTRDQSSLAGQLLVDVQVAEQSEPPGYRAAAEQVARVARQEAAAGLLVLPADVPLVKAGDLERLLAAASEATVVLVGSSSSGGTNALLTCPPGVLPYRYGHNSLAAHRRLAERRGLTAVVLELDGLVLDLDEPRDLERFLEVSGPERAPATWRYAETIGLAQRVSDRRR